MDSYRPCLLCRKRRVKCDQSHPDCLRCLKDSKTCPRYQAQLKIKQHVFHRRHPENRSSVQTLHGKSLAKLKAHPISHMSFQDDEKEFLTWLTITSYYNQQIVPEFAITPAFRQPQLNVDIWPLLPQISRTFLILMVRCLQASKSCLDADAKVDLYYRRRACISDVKGAIPLAGTDPHGIALFGTILLALGDVQMRSHESWRVHSYAAQNIIKLRGGFIKCVQSFPQSVGLLTSFMNMDIFGMTTCDHHTITSTTVVESQQDYLHFIQERGPKLLTYSVAVPAPVLQAIIRTNLLRMDQQATVSDGEDILSSLECFDADEWSNRVYLMGTIHPVPPGKSTAATSRASWTCLGKAYQSSAIIYLVLSTSDIVDECKLESVKRVLASAVDELFQCANSGDDQSNDTKLWKFCCWPLFVLSYVNAGWCHDAEALKNQLRYLDLTRLSLFSSLPTNIRDLMVRTHRQASKSSRPWKWDYGFNHCTFDGITKSD